MSRTIEFSTLEAHAASRAQSPAIRKGFTRPAMETQDGRLTAAARKTHDAQTETNQFENIRVKLYSCSQDTSS